MSYDLYCYRPSAGEPTVSEAEALVEEFNAAEETGTVRARSSDSTEKIAAALIRPHSFPLCYRSPHAAQSLSVCRHSHDVLHLLHRGFERRSEKGSVPEARPHPPRPRRRKVGGEDAS